MYAYCLNNPVNRIDSSGEFSLFGGICAAIAAVASAPLSLVVTLAVVGIALLTVVENPPVLPPLPQISSPPKAESIEKDFAPAIPKEEAKEEKDEAIADPPSDNDATYYHVTTYENAAAIIAAGVMTGSEWEAGYVYAWKTRPNKYAIENSGAHMGVIISFKTNVPFVTDTGITDPKVQAYGPVVSVVPGPIVVWDVKIVG